MAFISTVDPNGFVYRNHQGDEAVITRNEDSGNIFVSLKTQDGRSYTIEKCQGYVVKEYNITYIQEDVQDFDPSEIAVMENDEVKDMTTVVNISIMFYYTQAAKDITPNIEDFIKHVVAVTNLGFINSQIPVRVQIFCIKRATITEGSDNQDTLSRFENMKGSPEALRNSADVAALITNGNSSALTSRAEPFSFHTGRSVLFCQKDRAVSDFRRMIGLTFGAVLNTETDLVTTTSTDSRLILPETPTGEAITRNRFKMAALGDESGTCPVKGEYFTFYVYYACSVWLHMKCIDMFHYYCIIKY